MGLFESFDQDKKADEILARLERIEQKLDSILEARGGYEGAATGSSATLEQEVLELLRDGRKIEAIKYYRGKTGVGLKDAKDWVEALWDRRG